MAEQQFNIGDRVLAKEAIYEGADDCHPGGYMCRKGDLLIVRKVHDLSTKWPYSVSHEGVTDKSFAVDADEIEPLSAAALAQQGNKS